ncbi:peptidylprolyl isomerase [Salinirubellus salinus]|uniref:peptidylprolyl isomerase n=1 Tax=Salinirubellus salinus TaxID=1364945 RepID=A0A9E7UC89_9EURY|nr:peptidylprolyl isomerase [Salinirubellus salinus]UWM56028.1 peptidylprolyl isomerase [Salinirubellus salinus]
MSDSSEEVEEEATEDVEEEVEETEAETEATETEAEEESTGLQEGDFIRLAYTARTVEGGQLVDTTDPDVAEEEGVGDQGTFEPRVIVLGSGHLFESVEEAVIGKEAGESGSVSIPAAEAFGEYDESQVETVAANKIEEDDRYPGARIQIDGRQGTLETIIGGRARVDFNHPLAGEDIEYDFEVVEVVDDQLERAEGLLNMFLDMDLEMRIQDDEVEETSVEQPDEDDEDAEPETVTETVEKRTLYVEATPQLSMNQQWMFQKQQIAQEIIDKTDIDRIVVEEVLDGGGMMGGMGGMMGGMGGGGEADIEEALEEADIDADEIAEDL